MPKKQENILSYPRKLLEPVSRLLSQELAKLRKNRQKIKAEDPFANEARITDNASPDTDAEEQFGHARTSAIRERLDRKIIQTRKALSRIKIGKYGICEKCGKLIDTDRLIVYPQATLCVNCERDKEK